MIYVKNVHEQIIHLLEQWDKNSLALRYARKHQIDRPEFAVQPSDGPSFIDIPDGPPQLRAVYFYLNLVFFASEANSLARYAEYERMRRPNSKIDFDDLRIREWTKNETRTMMEYFLKKLEFVALSVSALVNFALICT